MADTKTVVSVVASLAASAMLIGTLNAIIPSGFSNYLSFKLQNLSSYFSSDELTFVIEGYWFDELFMAVNTYLAATFTSSNKKVKASKTEREKLVIAMDKGEEVFDVFENVEVKWKLVFTENVECQVRLYELTFLKKHKEKILQFYLPYILQQAKIIKEENKVRKLHLVSCSRWQLSTNLDHPMRFDAIAMDKELKKAVMEDLNNFMNGKELYRRIGKAWKRGYLIYGPSGSGKSSLIAAIANHLNYSIHEIDLSDFEHIFEIRALLLHYINRSVLVFKDIDSSIKLHNRQTGKETGKQVQKQELVLKLLNYMDGLWLPRAYEVVIVVTSRSKEVVDPALLMAGRIDMQIPMSYCTISTIQTLFYNYHHSWFYRGPIHEEMKGLLENVRVTPAEVVKELTKSTDSLVSVKGLIQLLHQKQNEER